MDPQPSAPSDSEPLRGLGRLLDLQALDLAIDRLVARRDELSSEREIRDSRERVADAEARLGEVRLTADEVSRAQSRLESDIDGITRKMEGERRRLFDGTVANAKELQSIEAEVAGLAARKSRVEDQLLELMERREELDTQLAPLQAEAEEARRALATVEEGSARELVEVEDSLRQRAAERDALVPLFDPELLELYEDTRRQKRGVGVAGLVNGVCQGCHQQLSPVYLERLKRTDGIRRCEHCRRILIVA
jgi:predicted  nucleic acid-binding Zn-ribbon protein